MITLEMSSTWDTNPGRDYLPFLSPNGRAGHRKGHSQQSGSFAKSYVTLMVLPLSWPLGAIFGTPLAIFDHSAWPLLSLARRVAGCHIGGKLWMFWAAGA
jgi:hypothetical protein